MSDAKIGQKGVFSKGLGIRAQMETVITIVSGLPRSGTSMMMRMLKAGGMKILTDNEKRADEDNPKCYYEFEKVKYLRWFPCYSAIFLQTEDTR